MTNIDTQGNRYVENHPVTILSNTFFQIEYSDEFNDPAVCLFYAYEIIDVYGDGRELCGMGAERIAKEIYAHALGYTFGEAALSIGDTANTRSPEDYYDYSTTQSDGDYSLLLKPIGELLVTRCSVIDVNKGDRFTSGYDMIWWYRMSGAYKALIHLQYLAYKDQANPHPHGGPNKQMLY